MAKEIGRYVFLGELGLNGELRPVRGVLLAAILARKMGYEGIFVPADNAREAAVVDTLKVYGAQHLKEVVEHLTGVKAIAPTVINTREVFYAAQNDFPFDFSEVKGQENVKRAFDLPKLPSLLSSSLTLWTGDLTTPLLTLYLFIYPLVIRPNSASLS